MVKRTSLMVQVDKESIEQMKAFEVEPPEKYKTGKAKRYYAKKCYKKAYDYIFDVDPDGGVLVHGVYTEMRCGHAWVELPGDIVFDGVLQRFYNKQDYYREKQADKRIEFTRSLAIREALGTGHHGPWFLEDPFEALPENERDSARKRQEEWIVESKAKRAVSPV